MENEYGFKPRSILYINEKGAYTPDIGEAVAFKWDDKLKCFVEKRQKNSLSTKLGMFIVTALSLSAMATFILCCLKFVMWIWGL